METNVIYNEDCIKGMKERIPDNSIDLIVTDPPYNIGKEDWDKIDNYIEWCGEWISQCERTLKDNGSFYFFHNDFEVLAELHNWIRENINFKFRQLIIWNKRYKGASNKGFLDGFVEVNDLRNYQKMAEYCLFYTFPELERGKSNLFYKIRKYIDNEINRYREKYNLTHEEFANKMGFDRTHIKHWRTKSQWMLITKKNYLKIRNKTNGEIFNKPYSELQKMYEQARYTFNNQKTHHSVWNYEIAEKKGHITPKPIPLIENILKHSSNESDIVLDCFGGSGTTAKACQNLNRQYILFEDKIKYVEMTKDRLRQQSLFANVK